MMVINASAATTLLEQGKGENLKRSKISRG